MAPSKRHLSEEFSSKPAFERQGWLVVWGGLVGLFTGVVTVIYRWAVDQGNDLWRNETGAIFFWNLLRVALPGLGGLLVGLFLYKYLKRKPAHGVPSVIHAIQTNRIRIPWRIAVPSAASVLVLTSGGSAGPEGPAAEIGAVFGSNTGKAIRADPKTLRALVGAGVAAAIAAVFSAPIGGVFFALEVIFQGFELTLFSPVVMAAVVASIVSEFGFEKPAIGVESFSFHTAEFPFYLGLGIVVGLMSAFFIRWLEACSNFFDSLSLPLWVKPAVGGIGVGLIGMIVPEVIGEGYEFINRELEGNVVITSLFFILVGKVLATGLTLGSGAPGGSFAPAIFVGGALGGIYGGAMEILLPEMTRFSNYALMGMAGMVAGTFNAPMTAIMITLRVTRGPEGDFSVLIPLMTTVAVVHFVMSRWDNVSVYTQILKRQGRWYPEGYQKDPLLELTVGDVLVPARTRLCESLTVEKALEYIGDSDETVFVIDDEEGHFRGLLTLHDLRLALSNPLLGKLVTLGDMLDESYPRIPPSMTLREAVRELTTTKLEALPVFNAEGTFIGIVTRDAVFTAYGKAKSGIPESIPS